MKYKRRQSLMDIIKKISEELEQNRQNAQDEYLKTLKESAEEF